MSRLNSSVLWDYFEKTNLGDKKARCRVCSDMYSYRGSTGNLKSHLKKKHKDAYIKVMEIQRESMTSKPVAITTMKMATTVANSTLAARRRDSMLASATDNQGDDDESNNSENPLNTLWTYFSRKSSDKVQCTICQATVDVLDMNEHLRTEHPKVVVDEALDMQDFDNEASKTTDDNETYTEIVYLDENIKKYDKASWYKTPEKKRVKTEKYTQIIPAKKDKEEDNDEIGKFIIYQTCLLRQLPKNITSKLQRDIINMILDEKMKLEERESAVNENNVVFHIRTDLQQNGLPSDVNSVGNNVTVITQESSNNC